MSALPSPLKSSRVTGGWRKVAVTVVAAVIVIMQAPVPAQPPPLQPANLDPGAAAAVRVTTVPLVQVAEQAAPQAMPDGPLLTVPLPAPTFATVRPNPGPLVPQATLEYSESAVALNARTR